MSKKPCDQNRLSTDVIEKARLINKYAQEYCEKYGDTKKPWELLLYLVEKGVFSRVNSRRGRDLREVLRQVDDAGCLEELLPTVVVERKRVNRYWYFRAV